MTAATPRRPDACRTSRCPFTPPGGSATELDRPAETRKRQVSRRTLNSFTRAAHITTNVKIVDSRPRALPLCRPQADAPRMLRLSCPLPVRLMVRIPPRVARARPDTLAPEEIVVVLCRGPNATCEHALVHHRHRSSCADLAASWFLRMIASLSASIREQGRFDGLRLQAEELAYQGEGSFYYDYSKLFRFN